MGNRYSANIEEPTILEFEFKKNSVLTNAYAVSKVTIHASLTDAQNNTNIIETVSSSNILNTDVGCYSYTVAIITTAGTYYDKIFLTPKSGGTETSYINSFDVTIPVYTGTALGVPSDPNLCRITGRTVDGSGRVLSGVLVFCRPWVMPGTYQNSLLGQDGISAVSDANGYYKIDLYKNVEYTFTVKETGLHVTVKIPDKNTFPLIALMSGVPVTPPSNPSGDTNW